MNKKKILWVVYDFVHAGGQRYVFEICKALNKEKYQIDFLKVAPLGHDKNWDQEFYYEPTLALGCRIFQFSDILQNSVQPIWLKRYDQAVDFINYKLKINIPRPGNTSNRNNASKLNTFLLSYDKINFSGVSVFKSACIDYGLHPINSFIHILTTKFQFEGMYNDYDKNKDYHFVSGLQPLSVKDELSGFENYTHTYFSLCFDATPLDIEKRPSTGKYTIAIFTRLSHMKPLDPYFYSLKLLLEQGIDVELNIYGAGDPEALGINRQLRYLYIVNNVKFMGHSENMLETLKKDQPDLIWFQSANGNVAGYAALDVSLTGIPQVLWDFMYSGGLNPVKEVFKSFTELLSFVNYSKELLVAEELRRDAGLKQRAYVLENFSIHNHIHVLEELYDK